MTRSRSTLLAAVAVLATALLPAVAEARDRGGAYYGGGYSRHYGGAYYGGGYRHRRHDNDDALVAGVAGLVIGTVIGSAIASQPRREYYPPPAARYYAPPPPAYYPPAPPAYYAPPPPPPYYGSDPGYRTSAPSCVLRERVWDPYAGQYVRVERRIPC